MWINLKYKSIFDVDLEGKTVFLRADLNSSVVEGRVVISSRLREHSKTIYALLEEDAKVVVLSHQGRKGEKDKFISLKRHRDHIKKFIDKPVKFVKWADDYVEEIKSLKNGEAIILDNTRFMDEEQKSKSPEEHAEDGFIKNLGSLGDYFVQDALSVCHRSHASVVGFKKYMPCFVGPVLERELDALEKLENETNGKLLVLGGAKLKDSVSLLKGMLESGMANNVCIGGLFAELFLKAKGIEFGEKEESFKENGFLELIPEAQKILERHEDKILLPVDLAVKKDKKRLEVKIEDFPPEKETMDIGVETTELFKKKIRESGVIVFNGPMGVYEKDLFSIGTKKILEAIAFHRCYSIIGGGDTERALTSFGLLPQDFSHVSLAGKALLQYLSDKPLPGLEILERG